MATRGLPTEIGRSNAPEPGRAQRPLRQLLGWGGLAALALGAVAFASRTEAGAKRLQLALAYVSEPARAVAQIPPPPSRAPAADAETRRLAAEVQALAADRERLIARIASLERSLGDLTGSVRQPAAPPPTAAVIPFAPVFAAPSTATAAIPAPLSAPLVLGPPAAVAVQPDVPRAPAEAVPLPRVRVASIPPNEAAGASSLKPEFGVDLGGAASLEVLRNHWIAMKGNYGALLAGLHPIVAQRPRHPAGVDYRLVVGPLPSVAAAEELCARFPVTPTGCRPAKFAGARLAER